MKLNVVKKVVSLVLAITMLMVSTVVFASEPQISPAALQWTFLLECDNSLEVTQGAYRKLTLFVSTEVYEGCAGVEAQLQKLSSDGRRWDDVSNKYWETYAEEIYCDIYLENISVSAGTYRCLVVHTAYTDDGFPMESFEAYTNEVTVY